MGFGLSPFGTSPFGGLLGPTTVLADGTPGPKPTPVRTLGADGDYETTADGSFVVGDRVDQEVLWRLRTLRGSFVGDPSVGNGVTTILLFNDQAVVATQSTVALALAPMLKRRVIANLVVVASPSIEDGTATDAYQVSYDKTGLVERP